MCTLAAKKGSLQLLKYAHENGCQFNKKTWYAAVKADALECLEYLFANGCPQDARAASMTYKTKCYEFIRRNVLHIQ